MNDAMNGTRAEATVRREPAARIGVLFGLVMATCLGSFGQITMATLSGIMGAKLSTVPELATLPVTAGIVGVAVGAWPLALLRKRFGNRLVFTCALLWAATGAILAGWSISAGSFAGFCAGCFMMGNNMSTVAQYRFVATELVPLRLAGRAVSAVMVGTLAAAVIAPWFALRNRGVMEADFAGSFVTLAAVFLVAAVLIASLPLGNVRAKTVRDSGIGPAGKILSDPNIQLAMVAAAAGYGVMSLIMTATPISMHVMDGHSAEVTADTIRAHILAMFVPSLFTGWLVVKLGLRRMLWLGALAQLVCVGIATSGHDVWNYQVSLVLLGVGWNLLFTGGTTLIATLCPDRDAARIQGINDFVVFGTMAVASLSAGGLLQVVGWFWTNVAALILIVLIVVMMLRSRLPTRARIV